MLLKIGSMLAGKPVTARKIVIQKQRAIFALIMWSFDLHKVERRS